MRQIRVGEQIHGSVVQSRGIFVGVVGYEQRSTYVARKLPRDVKVLMCRYLSVEKFSYHENVKLGKDLGWTGIDPGQVASILDREIRSQLSEEQGSIALGIDISSMQRTTIAEIISFLMRSELSPQIDIYLYYADAAFAPPDMYPPVKESTPIHLDFCAPPLWADTPTKLVLGLGYEAGRSIAAVEEFEVSSGWLFFPTGGDPRYEGCVEEANALLLSAKDRFFVVKYNIYQPIELIALLNKVISRDILIGRPVIVPFGPKIFSFCAMIVAQQYKPRTTIWRMSGGSADALSDRHASGGILTLRLMIGEPNLPMS
ncbi:hypothetical protein [Bradyrhizobium stylosanthis]|uniref:Uncharacterized protein n=1 Tax=Bradyrhizobium stylosanthis TaxID=1803665 RepID=A0A560D551_9BRAD|nr:hypothetical protein [Bradyrhizobium stylosanthis]TWA92237.1 hypothetical protein FBZ96_11130 [Bradyrhizobium stylosanthis]